MKILRLGLAVAALAVMLGGCFGKNAPNESYLRVEYAGDACKSLAATDRPIIMIRSLESMPALDTQAVLLAKDNVLQKSVLWNWEGKPKEIMRKVLANGLACSPKYKVAADYSSKIESVALLYGDIRAFEVITGPSPMFRVVVDFELWTERGKALLVDHRFRVDAPLQAVDAASIAKGADAAMADLLDQMRKWLDSYDLNAK